MAANQLAEAIAYLQGLVEQARTNGEVDANAAALATADHVSSRPSIRTIYVQVADGDIAFFVNAESGKGRQLEWNPQAALCFFWRRLQMQSTIEGTAERLSDARADTLWAKRPRDSQLAARASRQQQHEGDKASLHARIEEQKQQFNFVQIERPANWIGFCLRPERIEFWETGWYRFRMRHLYERRVDGHWQKLDQEP